MSILENEAGLNIRRFNRDEYYRMGEDGYFDHQRVELIDGEILVMAPQQDPHASAIVLLNRLLTPILPPNFELRPQLPLSINFRSEPEPDIAIVDETCRTGDGQHASTAKLIIEVSDSSLRLDCKKSHLYASADVNEYWILNIGAKQLHVYRQPEIDTESPGGATYRVTMTLELSDTVTPVAVPIGPFSVTSLFPPPRR